MDASNVKALATVTNESSRRFSFLTLSAETISRLVIDAGIESEIVNAVPITKGLVNTNYMIDTADGLRFMLKLYSGGTENFTREIRALSLVKEFVPVPKVIYSGTAIGISGLVEGLPYALMSWLEGGTSFGELIARPEFPEKLAIASLLGLALAKIHGICLPTVEHKLFAVEMQTHLKHGQLHRYFTNDELSLFERLASDYGSFIDRTSSRCSLVHRDFRTENLLFILSPNPQLLGVIDWEFASTGSPLRDLTTVIHREPLVYKSEFVDSVERAYLNGGAQLPEDWRRLAQIVDVERLLEVLSNPVERGELTAYCINKIKLLLASISEAG